ncbi:MAG TPA: DUF4426 domain-containing protein [Pseudomonas sp.]|jgi:hypothetical protein|uniref:DUF4426 domain-containing protein n=1 Tax=Pseudomonas sp. TaxID=306 RepID=UPI002C557214|nr:DUF4426 domain-containing protein [Pseudomonas sp.]HTO17826.1 DUF4426 domain-containing protein [Pseudomonas sp.]
MRRLFLLFFSLCLALPALAEQKYSFDELDVHYSAFNSSFLQPEIAAAVGLTRAGNQGVLNISVLKDGKPITATVSGQVRNLLGQISNLSFRQVREGEAVYYLAQFPIGKETLSFTINVQSAGGPRNSFTFNQEFFPDR